MKKRIVVTGMGAITPIGNTVEDFWKSIQEGRSGIDTITSFDTEGFDSKIAAQIKDFDPSNYMEKRDARKMGRFTQFAVAASKMAIDDAKLDMSTLDPRRVSISMGNGIGGIEIFEESHKKLLESGPRRMLPLTVPLMIINEAAGNVAIQTGAKGPAITIVTACAAGTDAIGQAIDVIRSGRADVVFAGGTEAGITPYSIGGFLMLKALSTQYNDTPQKASRPFDKDRDGFVIGEGAGMLILEDLDHAIARGAKIYAELAGYGSSCDAYHLTAPSPDGSGGTQAILSALDDAGMQPEEVDYFNAHGTSTPVNDPIETEVIKKAFGNHAYKMKVSSTKSMTGHCIAGGGAIEAIACIKAMQDGFFPPTINLDEADPACDLDYVPHKGVNGTINAAMSSSLGFGGHNAIIVFKRYV